MKQIRAGAGGETTNAPAPVALGPADETVIAHAEEIAQAVREAPPGICIRADAGDDRAWRGLRALSQAERNDPEQPLAPDGVAYFWTADPAATADAIAAEIRLLGTQHPE